MASSMMRRILWTALAAALSATIGGAALCASIEHEFGANEVKLGEEAAAEVAKEYRISDNAADLKRLRAMGDRIAAVANQHEFRAIYGSSKVTPFNYTFDIIEDPDINAFSLPGGRIYVHRGLLDFVQSDEELAAVLAHEITHAAHHHMVYLLRKQASMNNLTAIALLAAILGGSSSSDIGNLALGVQLYQIARLNGYGMQAERDADYGAVLYMHKSGYNPVGLLTFLERLAQRPELVDFGIYRSHPVDAERVKSAKGLIQELGLPINRRATTNAIKAQVRSDGETGSARPSVTIRDKVIFRPAPSLTDSAEIRAQEAAARINSALDSGLKMYEIRVDADAGAVVVRSEVVLRITDADAGLMNTTPADAAQAAAAAIRDVVWKEMVDTLH